MPRHSTRVRATRFAAQTRLAPSGRRDARYAAEFSAVVIDFSAGDLAQAAQCTKEAAKGWKAGRSMPSADALLQLGAEITPVRKWIEAKIARGAGHHLDAPENLTAVLNFLVDRARGDDAEALQIRDGLARKGIKI